MMKEPGTILAQLDEIETKLIYIQSEFCDRYCKYPETVPDDEELCTLYCDKCILRKI